MWILQARVLTESLSSIWKAVEIVIGAYHKPFK